MSDRLEQELASLFQERADQIPDTVEAPDGLTPRVRRRIRRRIATVSVVVVALLSGVAVAALRPGGGSQGIEVRPAVDPEDVPRPARILVTTWNQGVLVVDSTTGRVLDTLTATSHPAYGTQDVAVDPHGQRWYFTDADAMNQDNCETPAVRAQDFGGGKVVDVAMGTHLVVSPDGRFLATHRVISSAGPCDREAVEVTDLETGKVQTFEAPEQMGAVTPSAFTADSETLFLGSTEKENQSYARKVWALDLDDDASLADAEQVKPTGSGGSIQEVLHAYSDTDLLVAEWYAEAPSRIVRVDLTRETPAREIVVLHPDSPEAEGGTVVEPPTWKGASRAAVDASGRHLAAVAYEDGLLTALYRWSPGDDRAPRLLTDAADAAWIPDTAPARLPAGREPAAATTSVAAPPVEAPAGVGWPDTIVVPVADGLALISTDDGSLVRTLLSGRPDGTTGRPEIDRLGGRVLYEYTGECGALSLDSVPLAGGDPESVTWGVGPVSISPDGGWLAFPRIVDGCEAGALVLHEVVTGAERIWPAGDGFVGRAGWAPDGRRIAVYNFYSREGEAVIRILDTADPSASLADAPRLTDGRLADSVVVGDRWILAVIEQCDLSAASDCASEVVTVDGDTGEVIERLGSVPRLTDVDLDASGEHVLVCWSETDPENRSYSKSVVGELKNGKVRRIAEAGCGDW